MSSENNREDSLLQNLENRTLSLEKAERRHSFIEGALMVAMVFVFLTLFNGCDVKMPEARARGRWIETRAASCPADLSFTVDGDGSGIDVYISGAVVHTLTAGDEYVVLKYRMTLSLEAEEDVLKVRGGGEELTRFEWKE